MTSNAPEDSTCRFVFTFLTFTIKVKFWADMIERWADRNKRATFRPAELRGALAGPHCLREVIEAAKFRREEDIRLVASAMNIRPLLVA